MNEVKKHVVDRFATHLKTSFRNYCSRHHLETTDDQWIAFLIDQRLIPPTNLQKFAVLREFEEMKSNQSPKTGKTEMVNDLAHKFCLSERTVWNILQSATKPPLKKK